MTVAARITQADEERILKALKAAGYDPLRVFLDFNNQTMEIIIRETGEAPVRKTSSLDRYLTKE